MTKVPWPENPALAPLLPGDTVALARGAIVWRVYFAGGAYPTRWSQFRLYGPTASRFDHHNALRGRATVQRRGIQYAAADPVTCLAEIFQSTRVIDRYAGSPRLVGYALARELALLDLADAFITRVGAAPAINAVRKDKARAWSALFYRHFPQIDGLFYRSAMYAHQPAYSFYERAADAMPPAPVFDRALADAVVLPRLAAAAATLGYHIV